MTRRDLQKLTCAYSHGWNIFAVCLVFVGSVVAVIGWLLISLVLGDTLLAQMIAFGIGGVAMTACDLVYRALNKEYGRIWRFFSPTAGGSAIFVPGWCLGLGAVAVATFSYLSES